MSNRTMAATPSPTGLYWSERGEIACAKHTPYEGTDTWNWERWAPLPVEAIAEADYPLRCETCGKPEALPLTTRQFRVVREAFHQPALRG